MTNMGPINMNLSGWGAPPGGVRYDSPATSPMYGQSTWSANGPWGDWMDWWRQFYGDGAPWKTDAPIDPYHTPGAFTGHVSASNLSVDPMDVVRSARPKINEEMNRSFGSAANRLGAAGMLSSSGYATALGDASRKASNDLANVYYRTLTQAAENQASREMQARLANYQGDLSAWGTRGGWDVGLQQAGNRDKLAAWQQAGNWDEQWAQMMQNPLMRMLSLYAQQRAGRPLSGTGAMDNYDRPPTGYYEPPQGGGDQVPWDTLMRIYSMMQQNPGLFRDLSGAKNLMATLGGAYG